MKSSHRTYFTKGFTIAFALLFVIIFPGKSHAEDPKNIAGYGKTVWGMTVAEVLNSDPERIKSLNAPAEFKSKIAFLGIDNLKIGTDYFSALFLFSHKDQKLMQVNLSSIERSNRAINIRTFASIEKLLTEKYGQPTFKQEDKKISWKLPKTLINLDHMDIPGIATKIIITYKPSESSSEDSKNL